MKIDTPKEFLNKLFIGMVHTGPVDAITPEMRSATAMFTDTVIRIAKQAD